MLEIDMMADSQMPTDQGLGKISTLAEEYTELDEEIKDAETRLKLLKERVRNIAEKQLPEAMVIQIISSFSL